MNYNLGINFRSSKYKFKIISRFLFVNIENELRQARLAQSVERWTFNPTVVGSSPTSGVSFELPNSIWYWNRPVLNPKYFYKLWIPYEFDGK